jgi:N-acetylmuramoyl-L-alanine amidase
MNIDESRTAKGFTAAADVPNRTFEAVVIHHWGVFGQTHDGVVDFFCTTGPGKTSAHFVASAGRVNCIVSPKDVAWHAGDWAENCRSIGVECRPEASDADYTTVAELVKWIRDTYGDMPLHPHKEFFNTDCPGIWDLGRIDALARAGSSISIVPASTTPAPKPAAPAAPAQIIRGEDEIHWVVDPGDTLSKIQAYYNGPSVDQIAAYNRIDKDHITPGQKIWIPGPLVWNIEAPDTIRSVAAYYGLDPAYLASLNGLAGPDAEIYIGNTLIIKGA